MLGYISDVRLNELLGNARAAIVPGEEDFGLVPLEAAAAGRPTIAYRAGGALETIVEAETGAFFDEPNAESLAVALASFDATRFDAHVLRSHAEKFAPQQFIGRLRAIVERVYDRRAKMRAVCIAVAVFGAVYIGLDLNKLYALRYGADLGTYLQTLVNLAHGSSWNYGEWRPHFQVHDSWALGAGSADRDRSARGNAYRGASRCAWRRRLSC